MKSLIIFSLSLALLDAADVSDKDPSGQPVESTVAEAVSSPDPAALLYQPITRQERLDSYIEEAFASPGAVFRSAGRALGTHMGDSPPEWGQGAEGYARRLGSSFLSFTIQTSVEAGGAALLGQDPRYSPCRCRGFFKRLGWGLASNFVTYNNEGKLRPAYARMGARYASSFAELTWYPKRYSWKDGLRGGNQQFFFGGFNVLREFWPEIRRIVPGAKR